MLKKICKILFPILIATTILRSVSILAFPIEILESLDLSGQAPPYLEAEQIRSDIQAVHWLLKQNYGRYGFLKKNGTDWNQIFDDLEQKLIQASNPPLTHHFLESLMETLSFTEDTQLRGDLFIQKRHYLNQVEPKAAFYSGIQLVLQEGHLRVLPNLQFPKISNHSLLNCKPDKLELFPVIGDRNAEKRYMLGMFGTLKPDPFKCVFENELDTPKKLKLETSLIHENRNRPGGPLFKLIDGHIPYVIWYRDGSKEERATSEFVSTARRLSKYQTLIIDVRGNHTGSFKFIESWLREITNNHWENVIVREKQTIPMILGLLNRTRWDLRFLPNPLVSRDMIEQRRMQLKALLEHFRDNEISEKWIETKFLFKGKSNAPKWNKRLIVVVNEHCGDGCQFLAALTRQEPDSYLIGSMTGTFPNGFTLPLFQLPNSQIMLSINHRMHLDHEEKPVPPAGYQPDYWLFPEMGIQDVLRFAGSL